MFNRKIKKNFQLLQGSNQLQKLSATSLRGNRKKKRELKEKEDRQKLRRQARTIPQVQLGLGCRMRGTGENMNGVAGFHCTGGAEEARDQSYPLL